MIAHSQGRRIKTFRTIDILNPDDSLSKANCLSKSLRPLEPCLCCSKADTQMHCLLIDSSTPYRVSFKFPQYHKVIKNDVTPNQY